METQLLTNNIVSLKSCKNTSKVNKGKQKKISLADSCAPNHKGFSQHKVDSLKESTDEGLFTGYLIW